MLVRGVKGKVGSSSEPAIVHMEIQEANWPPQTLDPSQEEIQELEKILSEARNPSSPLHKHFQWDDAKAAQAWREQQAEGLWNSIEKVKTLLQSYCGV